MEQGCEPCLLVYSRSLAHALQLMGHPVYPALCPGDVLLTRVSLGRGPWLHKLRSSSPQVRLREIRIVRSLPCYYGLVRLPAIVHRCSSVINLGTALQRHIICRRIAGSLSSRPHNRPCMLRVCDRAESPSRSPCRVQRYCLPLRLTASAFRGVRISRLNGSPAFSPSTLREGPHRPPRMTSGQDDWLGLSRVTLSFTRLCRFSLTYLSGAPTAS